MDAFLATPSLIFSHNATALLFQTMNRLAQKYIHSGFTFVFKQPLNAKYQLLQIILSSISKLLVILCRAKKED